MGVAYSGLSSFWIRIMVNGPGKGGHDPDLRMNVAAFCLSCEQALSSRDLVAFRIMALSNSID